jgi:hypothetical protein
MASMAGKCPKTAQNGQFWPILHILKLKPWKYMVRIGTWVLVVGVQKMSKGGA